jgi:hypothetical protein
MTPQANFTVLAQVDPAQENKLRALLESMNFALGRVDPNNALIPFASLDNVHYLRLLILKDNALLDTRAYGGGPVPVYPLWLALLGDIDGDVDAFFKQLVARGGNGLRQIFSCCLEFDESTDLARWMRRRNVPAIAAYVNWRGRTALQIREEATLRDALEKYLADNTETFRQLGPREVHRGLRNFAAQEIAADRLKLTAEQRTPLGWWIGNALHLIGLPLIGLLFLPLLILAAPIYVICLRRLEKTDPELCWPVDPEYSEILADAEDHYVTNQFTAMGSVKPGLLRRLTLSGVLTTVNWAARHITSPGRLGRIRTIHFARWVYLDGKKRMIFFSNYDGTVESYMDDFINKTGFGLNAVFSNGIGYPRTNWLVLDGCQDEQKYKDFLRRHTLPSQVWYKAYPGLTAIDLERNTRIRQGLEAPSLNADALREWVALL